MAWSGPALATGSRDRAILSRDVRAPPGPDPEDADALAHRLGAHRSEVCGLRWSPDGRALASGGNDNLLHVWCPRRPDTPRLRLAHHTAAIKALAWSPHQHGLLASGGGTADRCIRVWNTAAGPPGSGGMGGVGSAAAAAAAAGSPWPAPPPAPLAVGGGAPAGTSDPGPPPLGTLDTGSQVCNLAWARHANELVSTHGYSQNQVALWRYGGAGGPGSLTRLATLTGHTLRVLYLAAAPDGQTVVTGAGDETLRFWSAFPGPRGARGGGSGGGGGGDGDGPVPLGAMARANIR
jgi:cell division cycle 20-like protein 1 (cofactor of APC complex)